jgi:hypothetical protein
VRRPLTLVASDTEVRILDGAAEIARHHRSYDRQQVILDPAHEQALLRTKRKALHATRAGRLALAVPESEALLERAFAEGESAARQTAQLLRLLDLYGVAALRSAIREALNEMPRASSVASCCADSIALRPAGAGSQRIRRLSAGCPSRSGDLP